MKTYTQEEIQDAAQALANMVIASSTLSSSFMIDDDGMREKVHQDMTKSIRLNAYKFVKVLAPKSGIVRVK